MMSTQQVAPEWVGPYQILGQIGRGGMARVYKAIRHPQGQLVALKVLPEELYCNTTLIKRFRSEAEVAASLCHPNIVQVWDASIDSPPYYIAMEHLAGGDLAGRLAAGALPRGETLRIMEAICSALDHAHQKGITHRDIKPANILFDEAGRPVLTDFSIARVAEQTHLTTIGSTLGTVEYMSPEQARGRKVDSASDLYSAGVVFYEMLTGHLPFQAEDPRVMMHRIIYEPVPMDPLLGQGNLAAVLSRTLAKEPSKRYRSGEELFHALWEASHPVAEPAQPRVRRKDRRRRLILAALAVVICLLAVLLSTWIIADSGVLGFY